MMLVARMGISFTLHEVLHRYICFPYRIENDMHMDIAGGVMPVRMCADDYLMPGEIPFCEIHCKSLGAFCGQAVFITVSRIEAYDVMVSFDIFPFLVFMKKCIRGFALSPESKGITVYAIYQIFFPWDFFTVFIKDGCVRKFIML